MNAKLCFTIEEQIYVNGASVDRVFSTDYGNWFISIGATYTNFRFILFFSPYHPIDPELLKDMTVAVRFDAVSPLKNYSFEQEAFQREDSTIYEVNTRSIGLSSGHNKYSVTVMINAIPPLNLPRVSEFAKQMFAEEKAADITIKTADGKEIKASKFILSRSPVFDAMLNAHDTKEAQEGIIEIADIKHHVMVEVVRYMYTDEIPKIDRMAVDLLVAGNKFDLHGLVAKVVHYMKTIVNEECYAEYLKLAEELGLDDFKKAIIDYIVENYYKVYFGGQWKLMKITNPQLAFEVYERHLDVNRDDDDE